MKANVGRAIVALAICCTTALGCANDTGAPKNGADGPSFPGASGFAGVGTTPPLAAGTGSVPPTSMGMGGSGFEPTAPSCADAKERASGFVSDACVQCSCNMKPTETGACTTECWALLACVSQRCDPTDVNCVVSQCGEVVGGAANLAAVGALARAVPFMACASQCMFEDFSEAGPENDF
jgi:hypothetical protein